MIKVIIFDLWETLGVKNIGISQTLKEHFRITDSSDYIKRYCSSIQTKKWRSFDRMASSFLNEFALADNEKNRKFVADTIRVGIEKATMFSGIKNLLNKLKRRYKLGLISDTTIFEAEILSQWNIEKLFKFKVWSWQTGHIKDVDHNFKIICSKFNVLANECLFIDNNLNNIKEAINHGMKEILFKSVDQLKRELTRLGIDVD